MTACKNCMNLIQHFSYAGPNRDEKYTTNFCGASPLHEVFDPIAGAYDQIYQFCEMVNTGECHKYKERPEKKLHIKGE